MLAVRPRSETPAASPAHQPDVGTGDGAGTVYVGLVTRAIALALDVLLIDIVALAVTGAVLVVRSVFSITGKHHKVDAIIAAVLFVVWVISYFVVFWSTTGQTPGSRVMHIRVVRSDGTRLRPYRALIRLGAMVVSAPLFWGYLPILTSTRRRGVPDALAGTVVVVSDGKETNR